MPLLHRETGLVARTFSSLVVPSAGQEARHETRPLRAEQVLASILDLDASVKLAHCLGDAVSEGLSHAPMLLGDYVRKRLEAIDDMTSRRLAKPFEPGRASVPDRAEMYAQIVDMGAAASPSAGRAFATTIARVHRDSFLVSVGRVRAEMAALREEVTEDLRQLGAAAARLEAIDGIVRGSIDEAMPRLIERAAVALESAFVRALTAEVAALEAAPKAEALAPWFAEGGVIAAQIARTRDVTRALLAHEAAVIEALVDAACRDGERRGANVATGGSAE